MANQVARSAMPTRLSRLVLLAALALPSSASALVVCSGSTAAMVSPWSSAGSRLTIGRPRVAGPPSGRRHTLSR